MSRTEIELKVIKEMSNAYRTRDRRIYFLFRGLSNVKGLHLWQDGSHVEGNENAPDPQLMSPRNPEISGSHCQEEPGSNSLTFGVDSEGLGEHKLADSAAELCLGPKKNALQPKKRYIWYLRGSSSSLPSQDADKMESFACTFGHCHALLLHHRSKAC